jgi:hypothetical protein
MAAASVSCLLKIASLNKFELCWCCHKTSWQPLLFDGYLLTLQEHFLTSTISFPNENRIHSYYIALLTSRLPQPTRSYIIIIGNHYSDYFLFFSFWLTIMTVAKQTKNQYLILV